MVKATRFIPSCTSCHFSSGDRSTRGSLPMLTPFASIASRRKIQSQVHPVSPQASPDQGDDCPLHRKSLRPEDSRGRPRGLRCPFPGRSFQYKWDLTSTIVPFAKLRSEFGAAFWVRPAEPVPPSYPRSHLMLCRSKSHTFFLRPGPRCNRSFLEAMHCHNRNRS